jgi:hypothetical protein
MGNCLCPKQDDDYVDLTQQSLFGSSPVTIPAASVEDNPPICETCRNPKHIQEVVLEKYSKIERTYLCMKCKPR